MARTVERISDMSEEEEKPVDSRTLKDLVQATKELAAVLRDIHGVPTVAEDRSYRLAAERLEIEKKRADQGDTAGGVEIVFGPGVEECAK